MKLNLIGKKFGKLTVISEYGKKKGSRRIYWVCKCDCGGEKIASGTGLVRGDVKSCGCLSFKHGYTKKRLWRIWRNMRERCFCKYSTSYKNYGGRGISVCSQWLEFNSFKEWALSNGYSDELSIDRIDNSKDYCPENCRWATQKEQMRNTRVNHYVEYGGRKMTVTELSKELGVSCDFIYRRERNGVRLDSITEDFLRETRILREKNGKTKKKREKFSKKFCWKGEEHTLKEWIEKQGLSEKTFLNRRYKKCFPAPVALKLITMKDYVAISKGAKK